VIVPVHYAGVACEMDSILASARTHGIAVVEDNAHGLFARYNGRYLGTFGCLATQSFHETKNIICGEGGALLTNAANFVERAEVIREKGTNRSQFFRGQVDKYTWVDVGSSYLPSELNAAFLWAQMEEATQITQRRLDIWERYHAAFASAERDELLRRPIVPAHCGHNAHMYYILLPDLKRRTAVIDKLRAQNIQSVFHYVPLHSAPAGQRLGRAYGGLTVTDQMSDRLLLLPFWIGLEEHQDRVIEAVLGAL
jgi:dTDP-4-amino-4,6-dideoxygalactose transaminase